MARVIDEIIEGVGLFIPDAHDYFSVETGGLPNGDDCLVVHGDVSQDYRAFANLVPDGTPLIASPRIDLPNMNGGWALSFWLKWGAVSLPATPTTANTIMGVFSQVVPNVVTVGGRTSPEDGVSWLMGAGGATSGDLLRLGGSWKSSGGTKQGRSAEQTVPVDGWHLIVFNADDTLTSSTAANMFLDQGIVGGGGGSSTNTSAGVSGGTYLSIGHYADTAGAGGRPGEYRLGKIAFHDHPLNVTERSVLYSTMLGL